LEVEPATLAAHISAGTCRWLELVGEMDRRGSWAEEGRGSCSDWLAWRCALPLVRDAFAHGELSYTKVRALTRVATAENERGLLELARVFTAAQLERAVHAYRRVTTRSRAITGRPPIRTCSGSRTGRW
jgi:hypothetical protein